jgi:hypothetical protein
MKRRRFDPLFPDGLSDETASALSDFLHQLAAACESRYLVQLRSPVGPRYPSGEADQLRWPASPLRPVRNAWASSRRSKTCGAILRAEKASPSLARRKALVA